MRQPITASVPFLRGAPEHYSIPDRAVHDAARAWAVHHAHCDHCKWHDWQRPGLPRAATEDETTKIIHSIVEGRAMNHIKVKRADGSTVFYLDEEDPEVLCDTGKRLYKHWDKEILRRVLKGRFD